tara:strand:- start:353 stop:832 length:480 start_codon:yes stop_codon:yes gene_type:complete
MKKSKIYILAVVFFWYLLWGLMAIFSPNIVYKNDFYYHAEDVVRSLRREYPSYMQANKFVEDKSLKLEYDNVVYQISILNEGNDWVVIGVPSRSWSYLSSFPKRILFLDFEKVYYPILLSPNPNVLISYYDEGKINGFKNSQNKFNFIKTNKGDKHLSK